MLLEETKKLTLNKIIFNFYLLCSYTEYLGNKSFQNIQNFQDFQNFDCLNWLDLTFSKLVTVSVQTKFSQ
jgi:hypothetical protein